MPAPAENQSDIANTSPPSARSDADDTVAASAASSSSSPAVLGFGPPAASNEVGTLGPYRIVKELGKGGMGAVYAAIDTRLERRLAMKVMLPEFAADDAAKERFLREASAAAKISHDNVVTVYEADVRQGVPYIAMQFLEGYPLDEYLKRKGLPTIPQVLRIAAETAAGLAAAHKIGLVHRDIKPGNLWLEAPHGRVKVLDFGLAKPVDAEVELTKSGAVVGTPAYMSPEQARGEKVDHRTDLFSLGSVMYRLCAGKLPFNGPTTMAVLMALGTEEPPPVRELNPNVPESLAALIHQLLAKRAEARPQTADEVVKRLRGIAQELATPRALPVEQSTSQPQMMQPQVVYVPIQVTALPPEQNPFVDLDSPPSEVTSQASAESSAAPADPKSVRKKPGGKGMWAVVGLVTVLAAVVVAGVVIVIKNKDGSETKIEVPDGATVTVKDKNGKMLAQVGPGGKQPAADDSADRKAAEYVLSIGGTVRVNGEQRDIKAAADLPKDRFTLTTIILADNKSVTDAGLAVFNGCTNLTELNLTATPVTDAGLANFKGCVALTYLALNSTRAADAGLAAFKDCKRLRYINLNSTNVTDAGLAAIKECKSLQYLNLTGTKVTDVGLAHLKDCKGLTHLELDNTRVTDAGLTNFRGSTGLRGLYLADTQVTDAVLAYFKDCEGLTDLGVAGTKVTDAGLAHLKGLKQLARLTLRSTQVTDAGLAHLKDHTGLRELNLDSTQVTDAGLAYLEELKALTNLYLRKTKVTAKGLADFHAAVPGCGIAHDGGTIEAVDVDRKAAEWVIAQGGGLRVNGEDKHRTVAADLPKERFTLTYVQVGNKKVSDTDLAAFKDLKGLKYLFLPNTQVTDAGLEQLKELKSLVVLDVRGTKVTAKGLEEFHAGVPGCRIEHDGGVIRPKFTANDRKAAEWVIAQGGNVGVSDDGRNIKTADELPKQPFALTRLSLQNKSKVTDADLAQLKDCKALTVLDLQRTQLTDAGLAHFKDHKALQVLFLNGTKVTDDGLVHLKGCNALRDLSLADTAFTGPGLVHLKDCKELRTLILNDTALTDAELAHLKDHKALLSLSLKGTKVTNNGLTHLKDCKALTGLDVRDTKVTVKGLEEFHAAVPGCRITHDGGVIEPKK